LLALLALARKEFLLLYQDGDLAPLLVKPLRSLTEETRREAFRGLENTEN
jgi:hypothetical protein